MICNIAGSEDTHKPPLPTHQHDMYMQGGQAQQSSRIGLPVLMSHFTGAG